ncbi:MULTISPECIES: YbhB/YbcL family Raf kinase inhibitor-like protein [unclassified Janthinobacterium]|uniref:YbhB/YbcL family Raf kinase inhibitor-like protein n=1 Tax=unclassified Janthinobacterium TaxID=2610881 RepID=UPI001E4F54A3|nr:MULTISPECIES: YbhB/YbcL family Raf kinase inhibitor-like protein [unclassified Janthinobacterium]MCC7645053.1 YbhB/YbcL family Raf kinase inhibitor-like protein [Janthinobacterium sp. EB271-G4-3-1]MCC7694389.1 YbhB/YbcL family Raf kinase inhibitor-like protein [Janthinobacterium sp. EB271-G4-3-2]
MKLWSETFRDGGLMPADNAFAEIDPASRVRLAGNRNPHLAWDDVPNGTESLALFCIDPDAPQDASLANRDDQALPLTALRGDFYHWSLLDLPPAMRVIAAGEFSSGITPRGKAAATGLRQGINDYTGWFAGDAAMAGDYYGYDGPCPPWNDERIHHYIFRLYALDVPQLALPERFTGQQAYAALYGHILDEAQLVVAYSLNPELALTLKK